MIYANQSNSTSINSILTTFKLYLISFIPTFLDSTPMRTSLKILMKLICSLNLSFSVQPSQEESKVNLHNKFWRDWFKVSWAISQNLLM